MGRRYYDCNYCNAYPSYLLAQWILLSYILLVKDTVSLKLENLQFFPTVEGLLYRLMFFFNFLRGERGGREEEGKGRQEGRKEREKGRGERGFK